MKPLPDPSMGALATAHPELVEQYGVLGVRFQTLRELYKCVVRTANEGKSPETCL